MKETFDIEDQDKWFDYGLTEHLESFNNPFSIGNECFRLISQRETEDELEYPEQALIKTACVSAYRLGILHAARASGIDEEELTTRIGF